MKHSLLKHFERQISPLRALKVIIGLSIIVIGLGLTSVLVNKMSTFPPASLLEKQVFSLILESPIDNQVITDNSLLIKGRTLPNTTIIAYTEKDINSIESNSDGQFEEKIQLSHGLNTLVVKAFSENGNEKNIVLDLVNDSQSIKVKGESTAKEEAPGQEKKQEAQSNQNQPPGQEKKIEHSQQEQAQSQTPSQSSTQLIQTAIVGNVEQVTSVSVVIEEKTSKQSIETKVDQDTLITNQDEKKINLDKIKLNDKAAVITENSPVQYGQNVIPAIADTKKAAKIFVKEVELSSQSKRQGIEGIITDISGNNFTIVHQVQTDRVYSFIVDKDTVVKMKDKTVEISDLKIQQKIAVVGDLNDEGMLVAKLIHIIPSKSDGIIPLTPTSTLTPGSTLTPNPTTPLTPTATSIPSGTLSSTPIPTVVSTVCTLISAKWIIPSTYANQLYLNNLIKSLSQGTPVGLNVTAQGDCAGKQVSFDVKENDSLFEGGFDESANTQPLPVLFTKDSQIAQGTWVAEWQQDCFGFCAPPEYYFNASIADGNSVRSSDPYLITFGSVDLRFDSVNPSVANDGYLNASYQFSADTTIPLGAYTLVQIKFWYDDQLIYTANSGITPQSPYVHYNNFSTDDAIIPVASGIHKLKVCIDTTNLVIESDETNNCKETIFSGPTSTSPSTSLVDLKFDSVTPGLASGGYLTASYQFSAATTIPLGTYTIVDMEFWLDDQLAYTGKAGIQPQSPYVHINNFSTDDAIIPVSPGTHKLKVCIDTFNLVIEPDEANNCKETIFSGPVSTSTTTSLVDLRFDSVNPSVANDGYLNASYQFSADTTIPLGAYTLVQIKFWYDDQLIYTANSGITPQSPYVHYNNFSTDDAIIPVASGIHKLKVCIDTTNLVIESDETNNCKESTFTAP